jgi:predicted membrane-bound dolichyl-phosphate-mannose-protein mannosyltransferase
MHWFLRAYNEIRIQKKIIISKAIVNSDQMFKFIDYAKDSSIGKKDLLTILILSLAFFSISILSLGSSNVPTSVWQERTGSFFVDLGEISNVSSAYVLVMNGSSEIVAYAGYPKNWSIASSVNVNSYYSWSKIAIDQKTQFVRFDILNSIGIAEVVILKSDGSKATIKSVESLESADDGLYKISDEQNLVRFPITYLSETYFDEIYFVRTAENYLNSESPFEWTHPPLGKLIMAGGIAIFGYNPFGWRIMGVIFATLMIAVIYVLGKKMFGTWIGAFVPALLLTLDFMHFTLGRMATSDTFLAFFVLASQLFFFTYLKDFLKRGWNARTMPLVLSVVFFSFAISIKWTALYGFAAELAVLLILRMKNVIHTKGIMKKIKTLFSFPFFLFIGSILLAALIYFSTFIPYIASGHGLLDVVKLQFSMYNYHATLNATHPFSSQWWSWPLMTRPIWLYISNLPDGMESTIALLGNPAIWWFGAISMIFMVALAIKKKDLACFFIAFLFLFQWVPYILISRITFIYHFYPDVPFLCLGVAYVANMLWTNKWGRVAAIMYLVIVAILFILFYPVISGSPAPIEFINGLKWLESWIF